METCKGIAITNRKGGVAKTAPAVNLGAKNPDELQIIAVYGHADRHTTLLK